MQVQIYADMVFMINFAMDYLIFWIVSKLVKQKVKLWRLVCGAFVASLSYCLLIFVPVIRDYYNIVSSIFILMLGIITVFGFSDAKNYIKLLFLSHISAFAVGGLGIALFYYTNISNLLGNMLGFTIEYFSLKILLVASCITYIFLKLSIGWIKRVFIKKQSFYPIRIFYNNVDVDLLALVDTGNSLCDPVSKYPVIVAEFKSIRRFLPEKMQLLFYENKEDDLSDLIERLSGSDMQHNIRMIPFKSLGRENGMMIGFKPDRVEITKEEGPVVLSEVIIGIYNQKLSQNGDYQGLLNPEMLENT